MLAPMPRKPIDRGSWLPSLPECARASNAISLDAICFIGDDACTALYRRRVSTGRSDRRAQYQSRMRSSRRYEWRDVLCFGTKLSFDC